MVELQRKPISPFCSFIPSHSLGEPSPVDAEHDPAPGEQPVVSLEALDILEAGARHFFNLFFFLFLLKRRKINVFFFFVKSFSVKSLLFSFFFFSRVERGR